MPLTPLVLGAHAQETPDPQPDGAEETYDKNAVERLIKLVELINKLNNAMTGPKTFPVQNGPDDITSREGGVGLREMAENAIAGGSVSPASVDDALRGFRTTYHLDGAFGLVDSDNQSDVMVGEASAQGAIAAATAEYAYKRANASMNNLDGYIIALQASPDLKTSVDLNTRVMIEVAQQINESLRIQAAISSVAGTYFMVLGGEVGLDDSFFNFKNFNR